MPVTSEMTSINDLCMDDDEDNNGDQESLHIPHPVTLHVEMRIGVLRLLDADRHEVYRQILTICSSKLA
jgi:hypothetical protein